MSPLFNIITVARYEVKTLLRSWFFRIFSILAIVILIFFDTFTLTDAGFSPWMARGISSAIPYVNLLMINIAQAIIAIFLSSDFLKRDKKLDTTEVIYMRSMSNGDYVLGKTTGILVVFMVLNIIVLLIAAIFNIVFTEVSFNFLTYILYPLLISLPTLIFILGLAFLLMSTIRNQAVTFILLLGYIALTVFYLGSKYYYIFDYMSYNVPMLYSDIIGFGNTWDILIHRGIYFCLGLVFVFATVLLLKRLPQSKTMTRLSIISLISFLIIGLAGIYIYISRIIEGENLRAGIIELNTKLYNENFVSVENCKINIVQDGENINGEVELNFKNENDNPINKYIFSLNPGLEVQSVTGNGKPLKYEREYHILSVLPTAALEKDKLDSITVNYSGNINEEACYPDINNELREEIFRGWIYNLRYNRKG